jgi:hypothetical protein
MSTGLERSGALCTHNALSRQGLHVVAAMGQKKLIKKPIVSFAQELDLAVEHTVLSPPDVVPSHARHREWGH